MAGMTAETAVMRSVTSILQPARVRRKERILLVVEVISERGPSWIKYKKKRANMKLVKTRASIAVKKANEEPSVDQKRTIQIGWNQLNGRLIRVALGHVGDVLSVWGVNTGNNIYYRRVNNGWEQIPGQLSDISVGFNEIWGVNSNDLIYR